MSQGVMYVEILPSTKGIGRAVEKDATAAFKGAEKTGQGFFSRVGTWAKRSAVVVGGMVAAIGGLAVKGGISRALNIEDAQAKLKGLGHDTKAIEAIMENALASVKGTAFGLDAAATTAAAAVASGIKPGQELERYLRLTADAATIAGVSMEEMGSIINKVQAKGKAQMEDLNRLTERGIPIMQMLADEYGVTAEEMSKMVSRGEVDAERFRKALEDNVGGAALASGDTTRGAFANLMASVSRLGETFVGDGLSGAKTFFNEVTTIFDGINERITPWISSVQESLGGMFNMEGMGDRFLSFIDSLNIGDLISNAISGRGSMIEAGIQIVSSLIEGLVTAIPQIVDAAVNMIDGLLNAIQQHGPAIITGAVTLFLGLATGLLEALPGIIAAVVSLIPTLVTTLISMIPVLIEGGIQLFLGLLESLGVVIPQLLTGIIEAIPVIIEALIGAIPLLIEGGIQLLMGLIQAIPVIIPALITGALNMVVSLVEALVAAIPMLLEGAIQLFTSLIEALPIILPELIMAIVGLVPTITMTVIGLIPTLLGAAVKLFMALVDAVWNILPKLAQSLAKVWPTIWDNIKAIPGKMMDAGKNIMLGLIDGVKSMVGNVIQAAKDVGGAMLDGIKSFLGIKSPSQVFRDEVGKMVGFGLLEGIEDQSIRGRIDTAVQHMVNVPSSSASPFVSLEGARFVMDVDGRAVSGVIREHIHSELEPFGSGPVRAQFGGR